jgi:hypothetical protein
VPELAGPLERNNLRACRRGLALPGREQEALGELVGAAKEALLALSVGVGLDGGASWPLGW